MLETQPPLRVWYLTASAHSMRPTRNTEDGIRAVHGAQVVTSDSAVGYLEGKFGDDLGAVRSAMERLAKSYPPKELAEHGFGLYEQFRPHIPAGVKGWGAKGNLDLGMIENLSKLRA